MALRLQKNEAARLAPAHLELLHAAVLDACDAQDGVKDGVVDDPRRCAFDPGAWRCRGTPDGSCLTAAQVETAREMYAVKTNRSTGREIPPLYRGSELGWTATGWSNSAQDIGLNQFRYLVFKDPLWEPGAFDFDRDLARAEDADHDTINALDPDIRAFVDRGGRLIQYHGWNDPQISPGISVQYHNRVAAALGGAERARAAYRLFMAPGMGHCGGGEGPSTFDMLTALEQWVEQGKAPDRIVAARRANGAVDRTRPLCPYPQVAIYKGSGSTDEAENFVCGVR